jgi:1A family penicillin-binding protein
MERATLAKLILIAAVLSATVWGWIAIRGVIGFAAELDRATDLAQTAARAQSTIVMDRHGRPAFEFYAERRVDVSIGEVARAMVNAIVAVEDRRFYSHRGLDPVRIVGAAVRNVRARRIREGGSTVTQQLVRARQLSPVRTFDRKFREAMIALRLERRYTKAQILEEYLNTVYFGEGYYGVESAARGYFGKPASQLTLPEAALLAALVKAPSIYSPRVSAERAIKRRNLVLRLMREQQLISEVDLHAAVREPLPASSRDAEFPASSATNDGGEYFREEIRRRLMAKFGRERVLRGGLRVYTSYDPNLQRSAEQAIRSRIEEIGKNRKRARDLQGSLVALDPRTGDVLALVGGRSFDESPFNRATQSHRQAGSAFKPVIFAAALERGYAPGSMVRGLDVPIDDGRGESWLPRGEHEESEYTLRSALKVSSNRAAAQLLQEVGVATAVSYAHRLGIASVLPEVPSLALGTGEVTLLELTAAYGSFANQGVLATPRFITRVEDTEGTLLWSAPVDARRAISQTNAFLMSSMLADVVSGGTAASARASGFRLPAAGKTGTTNDFTDAWFVGYTPNLVAGVWFGLDTPAPIMSRGFAGVVAVPAWARFMKAATTGAKPDWYAVPTDVEKVTICRISGARAADRCRYAPAPDVFDGVPSGASSSWLSPVTQLPMRRPEEPVYEDYFPRGTVPPELCPLHSDAPLPRIGGVSSSQVRTSQAAPQTAGAAPR